ncbi:hypothetical protein [Streptomyces sp. NPDC087297]|uniref:hypothetical protein n=1 Tax=Streptomyces sp. NPDC087297 TaxID=3365778 RepID=UPI00380F3BD4
MPEEGRQLPLSARAELITAPDPYFRRIDADAFLPCWITVRPLASTSAGGPDIAGLAGGRDSWCMGSSRRTRRRRLKSVTGASARISELLTCGAGGCRGNDAQVQSAVTAAS